MQGEYLPKLSHALLTAGIIDAPLQAVVRKGKSHYVCDKLLKKRLLTSGTLAVGNDFQRYRTQVGLREERRVQESVAHSPFDYHEHCLRYLPLFPPKQRAGQAEEYFDELTAEIMDLLKASYGHALVLFTSYAAMSAVKDRLQKEILRVPLFTLGRNAVHILEEFRATPGSVLLATGAAWEGIDFPGDCVLLLIIPRLPFAYPEWNGVWKGSFSECDGVPERPGWTAGDRTRRSKDRPKNLSALPGWM